MAIPLQQRGVPVPPCHLLQFNSPGTRCPGFVEKRPPVVDDQEIGGKSVVGLGSSSPSDGNELVEAAIKRDIPGNNTIWAAGGPGKQGLFFLRKRHGLLRGNKLV